MLDNTLHALLALQKVPGLGIYSAKKLIHITGSAQAVFSEKHSSLEKIPGLGRKRIKALFNASHFKAADAEMEFISKTGLNYWCYQTPNYPALLTHCPDSPLVLFHRGAIQLETQKIISIVGTRKISKNGKIFCEHLLKALAPFNPVVVSGFAYGADITAHLTAHKLGLQTIACFAHGFTQVYPSAHKKYVAPIENNGGFVSEFWSTDTFTRSNFLKRNRIIAGLSQATIVLESSEQSGSLSTANFANDYHREVFAVPGSVFNENFKGCHSLIKTQRAHLLSDAQDVISLLGWKMPSDTPESLPVQLPLFTNLSEAEKDLLNLLSEEEPIGLDTLSITIKKPVSYVAAMLLELELKGLIKTHSGQKYARVNIPY